MPPPVFVQLGENVVPEFDAKRIAQGEPQRVFHPSHPPPYFEVYEVQPVSSTAYLAEYTGNGSSHIFSDKSIRIGFIRKVFAILSIQVLLTFGLVAVFAFVPAVNDFLHQDPKKVVVSYIAGILLILDFVCILLVGFQPKWMTKTPINYIFLAFVTICTAGSLAIITAFITSKLAVFYIVGMTLSVVMTVTIFTLQSRKELTFGIGFLLAIAGVGLSGVVMYFAVPISQELRGSVIGFLIVAGILTILFAMLWIFLVEKMMLQSVDLDSKSRMSRSPDEFILAAMYLYLGTVLIFLFLLVILVGGESRLNGPPLCCCWWYTTPIQRRNSQTV